MIAAQIPQKSYAVTTRRNSETRVVVGELRGYAVTRGLYTHVRVCMRVCACAHVCVCEPCVTA